MARRRSLLVAALVAAPIALVAAVGTAFAVESLRDEDDPSVEADLRLSPGDEQAMVEGDPTGDMAPHTSFPLLDGGRTSLDAYEGTPVVLNFFASWCEPCKEEMPALDAIATDLAGQMEVVGIGMDPTAEASAAFAEEIGGVSYDLGHDEGGDLAVELGVVNLPTTFFLSADHEVVEAHPGVLTENELRERAEALLGS